MIGKMQKVEFMVANAVQYASGGGVEVPVTVITTFAWVRPTSSNRTFLHNEGMIIDSYNFDVPYRTSFTPTKSHFIRYRGKYYAINGITDVKERRRFWRIFAIAEV